MSNEDTSQRKKNRSYQLHGGIFPAEILHCENVCHLKLNDMFMCKSKVHSMRRKSQVLTKQKICQKTARSSFSMMRNRFLLLAEMSA